VQAQGCRRTSATLVVMCEQTSEKYLPRLRTRTPTMYPVFGVAQTPTWISHSLRRGQHEWHLRQSSGVSRKVQLQL
jgi:hypothetical protein